MVRLSLTSRSTGISQRFVCNPPRKRDGMASTSRPRAPPCHAFTNLLALLALVPAHGMLSLPRVAARQAASQWRRGRCDVRSQVFPGDFAQQSEREADESGDAARAVLRARRAIGTLSPDDGPSQEWSEGVLDGSGVPFWWREEAGGSGEVEVRLSDPALAPAEEEEDAEEGDDEAEEGGEADGPSLEWRQGELGDGDS